MTDQQTIKIDENTYNVTDLNPKSSLCVSQISDINNKLNKLEFDKTQLIAAKNSFSATLQESIKEVTPISTEPAPIIEETATVSPDTEEAAVE